MTENVYPYQLWETILYSFVSSFPFMLLALYAFRDHWRFGKKATYVFVSIVLIFQMTLTQFDLFLPSADHELFNIIRSVCYIAFIFAVLKAHLGKLTFTVLVLSNLGEFAVFGGNCLERFFFPEYTSLIYHFTFSLFMLLVLAVELPVIYLLVFKNICTHSETPDVSTDHEKIGSFMWRYLWLVPGVFYLIERQFFYFVRSSGIDGFSDYTNTLYLFIIDAGSVLIYRIIIQAAELYKKNIALLSENHTLSIQQLQYDSLNERLENMRRTRHDIRHHTALLKQIRTSGDMTALDELINMYTEDNFLDKPLIYCENETVNVVLALYFQTAYENNIAFSVKAIIPKDIFVDKKDLAVLFGNILENASDACKEAENDRFIDLTSSYNTLPNGTHSLSLIVKNCYGTEPSTGESGTFHSTKHPGDGIGISSVKSITEKYGGACSFTPDNGIFTVSVILYG